MSGMLPLGMPIHSGQGTEGELDYKYKYMTEKQILDKRWTSAESAWKIRGQTSTKEATRKESNGERDNALGLDPDRIWEGY